jgi:hypothetical protein
MARFIGAGYARYINVADVEEFFLEDGRWFARLRSGGLRKLGEGEYPERLIAMATAAIVPAAPDEVLHRFWLSDEEDRTLVHDKERIIAWIIDPPYPTPVTAYGPVECGWHGGSKMIVAIQQTNGRYDDIVNQVYADEEEVRRALDAADTEVESAA